MKEIVRALGLNPEEILTKKALAMPHRIVITAGAKPSHDQDHVDTLLKALKQKLKQEITAETTDKALKTV
ncbi:hypothetical protein G4O51_05925 [Candidatus Bathyarchaeota archaeon A05DMB-2]|nr:hypothetical protein [Candidatus Bathyarchaeota archaeon A05DMB-2]